MYIGLGNQSGGGGLLFLTILYYYVNMIKGTKFTKLIMQITEQKRVTHITSYEEGGWGYRKMLRVLYSEWQTCT